MLFGGIIFFEMDFASPQLFEGKDLFHHIARLIENFQSLQTGAPALLPLLTMSEDGGFLGDAYSHFFDTVCLAVQVNGLVDRGQCLVRLVHQEQDFTSHSEPDGKCLVVFARTLQLDSTVYVFQGLVKMACVAMYACHGVESATAQLVVLQMHADGIILMGIFQGSVKLTLTKIGDIQKFIAARKPSQ